MFTNNNTLLSLIYIFFFIVFSTVKSGLDISIESAMDCSRCEDAIVSGDGITCTGCNLEYHYYCQGMQEVNFRKMGQQRLASWKCFTCKQGNKPKSQTTAQNESKNTKFKEQFESNEHDQVNDMATTKAMFEELKASMQFNSDKLDEILTMFKETKEKMQEMEKRQSLLEQENKTLRESIETLKTQFEDKIDLIENRSRITNLEIRNVPETKGEDVLKIVQDIGKAIGIRDISEGDIQVAHRVDTRNKTRGSRPIIAHMASRYMRNKWLQKYKNLLKSRSPGNSNLSAIEVNGNLPDVPIHINEHITVRKKMLLAEAKSIAKKLNIKFVWVKDGFILIKKDENARHVQKINTKLELEEYERKNDPDFTTN